MICEKVKFKFGLPLNISLNSLSQREKFSRSIKLIWVLEGKITYKNNNFKTETDEIKNLKAGEIEIINCYSPFKLLKKDKQTKYLVFDFKYNYLENSDFNFEQKIYNLNNLPDLSDLKYLTVLIAKDYFSLDNQLADKIKGNLDKLLLELDNKYCIYNQRQDDFFKAKKNDIVIKVIEKLETELDQNLTLKDIAAEFHYNSSYLSEKFKSLTGVNFKNYLDRLRLEKILTFICR